MKRFFYLAFILLLITTGSTATAIVIIVTPKSVILGADSRRSSFNNFTFQEIVTTTTKIYKSGEYHFAISGLTSNETTFFDASLFINYYLKEYSDVTVAIDSIKIKLAESLRAELKSQKRKYHKAFLNTIKYSNNIMGFGIIGVRNSKPFAHLIEFNLRDTTSLNIKITENSCPGNCKDGVLIIAMGANKAIANYMQQDEWMKNSPIELAEKLISLEIEKEPEYVGGPIDIVEVTADKTIWHKKKEDCPIVMK
jgi:hypothetical protein